MPTKVSSIRPTVKWATVAAACLLSAVSQSKSTKDFPPIETKISTVTNVNSQDAKEKLIPDFCQENKELPSNGITYCGPVATSNILVYLDKNGFPDILQTDDPTGEDQLKLIKILGSNSYMDTTLSNGTIPIQLMSGLEKYVISKGYKISIDWKGWDGNMSSIKTKGIPDPMWLKKENESGREIILMVGFFSKEENDTFKRINRHYVTLVDFKNDMEIYVHDPSTESGKEPKKELCKFVPMGNGQLRGIGGFDVQEAKDYWEVQGLSNNNEVAVLEGALSFEIE